MLSKTHGAVFKLAAAGHVTPAFFGSADKIGKSPIYLEIRQYILKFANKFYFPNNDLKFRQ